MEIIGTMIAAVLTLAIFSFLYADNPVYKAAEHLFVGVSAGYWFGYYYENVIDQKIIGPFFEDPVQNWTVLIPTFLSVLLLLRLIPKFSWTSRIPLAFMIGTMAGINFINYLRSNALKQVENTILPIIPAADVTNLEAFSNLLLIFGVITGLFYFFFSQEHKGAFGVTAKIGIYFLMVSLGASFGYTVMGRISLLINRFQFFIDEVPAAFG